MPRGKGGLGRGLESLFEDAAPSLESTGVRTVPLREIEPDPAQPRKTFGEEGLAELAASIAEHGLLQPIAVRPQPMGGYRIVAGEAAKDFDPLELVYPGEVPAFEKYDGYVPDELVRKGFAYGVLDIAGMKERVLSWAERAAGS